MVMTKRRDDRLERAAPLPIGGRLSVWRHRYGLSLEDIATRSGIAKRRLADIEEGLDWLEHRRELVLLSRALRLDPAQLCGLPYRPTGADHAVVLGAAFELRRIVATPPGLPTAAFGELVERIDQARALRDSGDEHELAQIIPPLIHLAGSLSATASGEERRQVGRLRVVACAVAAGLLRRLGYLDLAWLMLHRARQSGPGPLLMGAEETKLLIVLGQPEQALARLAAVEPADEPMDDPARPLLLSALAHSMAGRARQADDMLGLAEARAESTTDATAVRAAHVVVALEGGRRDEALEHFSTVDLAALAPARRIRVLVAAASASAQLGLARQAVDALVEADRHAPWRLRLDPFARELLVALPRRIGDAGDVEAVRRIAVRAGIQ